MHIEKFFKELAQGLLSLLGSLTSVFSEWLARQHEKQQSAYQAQQELQARQAEECFFAFMRVRFSDALSQVNSAVRFYDPPSATAIRIQRDAAGYFVELRILAGAQLHLEDFGTDLLTILVNQYRSTVRKLHEYIGALSQDRNSVIYASMLSGLPPKKPDCAYESDYVRAYNSRVPFLSQITLSPPVRVGNTVRVYFVATFVPQNLSPENFWANLNMLS